MLSQYLDVKDSLDWKANLKFQFCGLNLNFLLHKKNCFSEKSHSIQLVSPCLTHGSRSIYFYCSFKRIKSLESGNSILRLLWRYRWQLKFGFSTWAILSLCVSFAINLHTAMIVLWSSNNQSIYLKCEYVRKYSQFVFLKSNSKKNCFSFFFVFFSFSKRLKVKSNKVLTVSLRRNRSLTLLTWFLREKSFRLKPIVVNSMCSANFILVGRDLLLFPQKY